VKVYKRVKKVWFTSDSDGIIFSWVVVMGRKEIGPIQKMIFIYILSQVKPAWNDRFHQTSHRWMFLQMFDDNLFHKIVNWTNERARRLKEACTRRRSLVHKWEDTNVSEIKCFSGLFLLMGNVHMPNIKSCWQKNPL
jgi:hypothetical protein